ncbi:MAG TPA: ABC transporter permease, partial [Thermoanaerobaculia bacterium]|nr:ABC transporter permease [Thermoanaerobaculia bacterium]
MSSLAIPAIRPAVQRPPRHLSAGARLALSWEIVKGSFVELWAHKLRSTLTLMLLMLGVFALVVMTSVMDGVVDKVTTGFSGMAWDGTLRLAPRSPTTSEEQQHFAMSPGLRFEDLPRLCAPHPRVVAFVPRAQKRSAVRIAGGTERMFVTGVPYDYSAWMNRPIGTGRGLTEDDERRRSTVAVVGATLAAKLFGGSDPVGRDITVEGIPFRVVGIYAPMQIFNDEIWYDANGISIPLATYMDRMDASHKLSSVVVKLKSTRDAGDVSATILARARQAHHGIEDTEIQDLEAEAASAYSRFLEQVFGWKVVLMSLAATVLLVGGVGVLSVMLISFSDRRYEIGLRKAMGASDGEILSQFLLEA